MGRGPPWEPTVPSQRLVLEMRLNDDDATAPIHISLADEFPPAAERSCLNMDMASFGGKSLRDRVPYPALRLCQSSRFQQN